MALAKALRVLRFPLPVLFLIISEVGYGQSVERASYENAAKTDQLPPSLAEQKLRGEMAFSPDGKSLAVANDDGTVKLLDLTTGDVRNFNHPVRNELSSFNMVAYSKHGRFLAVSYRQDEIVVLEAATLNVRTGIAVEKASVNCMAFIDGDHTLLAELSTKAKDSPPEPPLNLPPLNDSAVCWDPSIGKRLTSVVLSKNVQVRRLSPDGRYAALEIWSNWGKAGVGFQKHCGNFDLATGGKVLDLGKDYDVNNCIFSADSSALIQCSGGRLSILGVPSGKKLKEMRIDPPFFPGPLYLSVSSNGKTLAAAEYPGAGEAGLIDLESGRLLHVFECGDIGEHRIRTRLSPDGRTIGTQRDSLNWRDEHVEPLMRLWRLPAKL